VDFGSPSKYTVLGLPSESLYSIPSPPSPHIPNTICNTAHDDTDPATEEPRARYFALTATKWYNTTVIMASAPRELARLYRVAWEIIFWWWWWGCNEVANK